MMRLQKAAMFGLDARIALAIFGALSVISGASLYSAIQEARVTAVVTEMNEIGKAWESYYIDTGTHLATLSADKANVDYYIFEGKGLVETNGAKGWNGPYLSYEVGTGNGLVYPNDTAFKAYVTRFATSVDWSARADSMCSTGRDCAIWIRLSKVKSESFIKAIDKKIDNSDGLDKGSFRWSGVAGDYDINLKYAPTQNPND